jgi:hypothetical protein
MFWGVNAGLFMMVFMSLLPAGIYQAYFSVSQGLWLARSPQIVHSKVIETLVWLRVPLCSRQAVFSSPSTRSSFSGVPQADLVHDRPRLQRVLLARPTTAAGRHK